MAGQGPTEAAARVLGDHKLDYGNTGLLQARWVRVACIVLIGIAVFLAIRVPFAARGPALGVDGARRYDPLARNLLAGRGFSRATAWPFEPDAFDQPGYPVFLAVSYWMSDGRLEGVALLQALLEALTVILVGMTGAELGLTPCRRAMAMMFAVGCPILPAFTRQILTETLATFALTAALFATARALNRGTSRSPWLAVGVAWGMVLLIRGDTLPTIGALAATAFLIAVAARNRTAAGGVVLASLTACAVLAPWTARNWIVSGHLRPIGGVAEQTRNGYVQWLDVWIDDPAWLDPYWWRVLDSSSFDTFPDHAIFEPRQRAMADEGLRRIRSAGALTNDSTTSFKQLALEVRSRRSFDAEISTPVRRLTMAWLRVPHVLKPVKYELLVQVAWVGFLVLVFFGAVRCAGGGGPCLLLAAVLAGRSVLPLISALGSEPRYLTEALPACFLLATMGFGGRKTGHTGDGRLGFVAGSRSAAD